MHHTPASILLQEFVLSEILSITENRYTLDKQQTRLRKLEIGAHKLPKQSVAIAAFLIIPMN